MTARSIWRGPWGYTIEWTRERCIHFRWSARFARTLIDRTEPDDVVPGRGLVADVGGNCEDAIISLGTRRETCSSPSEGLRRGPAVGTGGARAAGRAEDPLELRWNTIRRRAACPASASTTTGLPGSSARARAGLRELSAGDRQRAPQTQRQFPRRVPRSFGACAHPGSPAGSASARPAIPHATGEPTPRIHPPPGLLVCGPFRRLRGRLAGTGEPGGGCILGVDHGGQCPIVRAWLEALTRG